MKQFNNSTIQQFSRGFAAMVSILAVMALGLIFSSGFLFVTLRNTDALKNTANSMQGYYASEAGMEDAIYRIKNNKNIGTQIVLDVASSTATTTVSTLGNTKTVVSTGAQSNAVRKTQTVLNLTSSEVDFFYGVQVGEGGLEMDQNSQIIGSMYSNGSVVGNSGAKVTGDVWVAAGASPTLDANWTTQNSDFIFGRTVGAVVTIVDSAGDVGSYGSLALGSDGFARISYYDGPNNRDLKFVRCLNADCSSRNITSVDTGGDVGWRYSSIALGSDGFARISYYDNTNGNLKFIHCTDADCSSRNTTNVETTNDIGQFSSLALGSDGFARIAYYSVSAGDLKYARCTNADCTAKNITTIDSGGDVGKYTSIVLGSDGFARIAYKYVSSDDVKFARCTNDDCTTSVIKTVDTAGNLGEFKTSVALGSNGFPRIAYYDDASDDLKFARCLDVDCAAANIAAVDTGGTVGKHPSVQMGADGFARIAYYGGDAKFARCLNDDCSSQNISAVDISGDLGHYTSMALGPDGFGRISHYDWDNENLRYIQCTDADCTPPVQRADAAQSFQPLTTNIARRVSLYVKKVGSPSDIPIRIMRDESGRPGDSSGDIIASGTLSASMVTGSYGWVDVTLTTNPTLNAGQTYWIMADTTLDNNNYWVWGMDNTDGYAQGTGKYSADWDAGSWASAGGDLDFKVWVGGSVSSITDVIVGGNAHANTITTSQICGNAYYQTIDSSSLTFLNSPSNPTCSDPLTNGTAYPTSADPSSVGMPISQGNIDQWKSDAAAGGTVSGDYTVSNNVSLGPKEITGNLVMNSNNKTLTVTGTLYVHGNIDISNGSAIRCDAAYGANSCVVLADGWIHIANNGTFSGSGTAGSFLMMLTTLACDGSSATSPDGKACGHHNGATDVHNNANGVIFYASNGMINLHNGVNITEATAYKLRIDNTAIITYDQGLTNASFTSGPSAGWAITGWKEVQ